MNRITQPDNAAAVVCAGPSAEHTWPLHHFGDYRYVIAINSVVQCEWLGLYDYWFAGDRVTLDRVTALTEPSIGIMSMDDGLRQIRSGKHDNMLPNWRSMHLIEWQRVDTLNKPDAVSWTPTIAQLWLAKQGIKFMDFYGCDWNGSSDCAGRYVRARESANHWDRVMSEFIGTAEFLRDHHGVSTKRILPDKEQVWCPT